MTLVAYNTPNMGSYIAGEDLSAKQYTFVKIGTAAKTVVACDTQGEKTLGILMNAPESGEAADVALPGGGAKLIVDANVGYPDSIMTGTDGKGEVVTAAAQWVGAIADANGAANATANDVIPVIVTAFVHYQA